MALSRPLCRTLADLGSILALAEPRDGLASYGTRICLGSPWCHHIRRPLVTSGPTRVSRVAKLEVVRSDAALFAPGSDSANTPLVKQKGNQRLSKHELAPTRSQLEVVPRLVETDILRPGVFIQSTLELFLLPTHRSQAHRVAHPGHLANVVPMCYYSPSCLPSSLHGWKCEQTPALALPLSPYAFSWSSARKLGAC